MQRSGEKLQEGHLAKIGGWWFECVACEDSGGRVVFRALTPVAASEAQRQMDQIKRRAMIQTRAGLVIPPAPHQLTPAQRRKLGVG